MHCIVLKCSDEATYLLHTNRYCLSLRIGGILAPFIIGIQPVSIPLFIMGMSCLLGGIIAVFLPETLGAPLPETLEDVRCSVYKLNTSLKHIIFDE